MRMTRSTNVLLVTSFVKDAILESKIVQDVERKLLEEVMILNKFFILCCLISFEKYLY